MTDDEHAALIAGLHAAAERGYKPRCWEPPSPPSDPRTRAGDWRRGLWRLHDAHQALRHAMGVQRRRRLVCEDPADATDLRRAAERVRDALRDLDAALVPPAERERDFLSAGFNLDYRSRVVSLLDGPAPSAADLYLSAIEDESDAMREAARLERLKRPDDDSGQWAAYNALFRHHAGPERAKVLMSLAYWLLAPGVDPGIALGVLVGYDEARCRPPLGSDEVERVLRYVADRIAERLAGEAA